MSVCDFVEVAANEYADGAMDLASFSKRMQQKFNGKVSDELMHAAFTKAAQRYRVDYKALEVIKRDIANTIADEAWRVRPAHVKVGETIVNLVGAGRGLTASFDLSAPGRQGAFLLAANPRLGFKSFGPMLRAMASETAAQTVDAAIRTRPNAPLYEESGLYLAPLDHAPELLAKEEQFMSTLAERIPGIGKGYRGSERAYSTFLNKMRADYFDDFKSDLERNNGRAMTPEEGKAIANFVNAATGRGNLGKGAVGQAASFLGNVLFSPRLLASRIQLLSGGHIVGNLSRPAVAKLVARTYLQYAGTMGTVIGLSKLAGAQVNTDPKSSDFMKLRWGDTRVDLFAGLQQVAVQAARQWTGQKTTAAGETVDLDGKGVNGDRFTEGIDFMRKKLAPLPGTVADLAKGKNVIGQPVDQGGVGNQVGLVEPGTLAGKADYIASKNLVPITYQDLLTVGREQGIPTAIINVTANTLGISTSTYTTNRPREKRHSAGGYGGGYGGSYGSGYGKGYGGKF